MFVFPMKEISCAELCFADSKRYRQKKRRRGKGGGKKGNKGDLVCGWQL